MNDPHFVQIEDGFGELFEDDGCFILLQERFFASVLEEVSFAQQFSYNIYMSVGFVLFDELDDIGVMALFEHANLPFQHFSFRGGQLFWLDYLQGGEVASGFLFTAVDSGEVTFANTLKLDVVI